MLAADIPPPVSTVAATADPAAPISSSPSSCESSFQSDHAAETPTRPPNTGSASSTDLSSSTSSRSDGSAHDQEKHPKGKRKRTAAKDKSILETAYLANPKPDKAARLDIVKRVSLNEKEVQIWFQNRRQNDRRKSRPLSAQEIAALRCGGMQILSSDPVTYSSSQIEEKTLPVADALPDNPRMPAETPVKPVSAAVEGNGEQSQDASPTDIVHNIGRKPFETPSSQISAPGSQPHTSSAFSFSKSVGFLSNRWNPSSSFSTPSTLNHTTNDTPRYDLPSPISSLTHAHALFRSDQCPPSSCSSVGSAAPALPLPQSHVRLSLSLEGKAELVSNEASPPRLPPTRLFQRSHSALPSVTLPPISAITESLPPALGRGRSRDAHAWELCCDADAHDELTTQAENESNGSAVAAINLLRSTSGILQNNNAKRNCPTSRPTTRQQQTKKPKLSRTSSSMARMQTSLDDGEKQSLARCINREQMGDKVKVSMLISPSGDSDKENWSPDADGVPRQTPLFHERRPLPDGTAGKSNPRRTGRVLQDHPGPLIFGGNRARTMPAVGRRDSAKALSIFEDSRSSPEPKETNEVERFMRGEVSPSKKGDMDCIAGLLSLSQGNWR
ncbi:MBF complex negative regulatory component yox1 [Colletotrichum chlorophyti]|uniref:MBF complex negative regulatory component yox1 n=1 Tax=Colletotrichum chlorophyti TaxID=708187 RepID=A0A1Q8S0Z1_9PEZI|nr:MBF complex negative regulatory component yox1 [Colletotrichum chlorophyti]